MDLENFGYLLLFFYSLGGGLVGIVSAGVLSALGKMDLATSTIIACVANALGSSALALLARYQKNEIYRYLKKHRRKLAIISIWLKKYGIALIFAGKFIYGAKTLIPLAIGLFKYNLKVFLALNLVASAIWALAAGAVGFYASFAVLNAFDSKYSLIAPCAFLALLAMLLVAVNRASKRRKIR